MPKRESARVLSDFDKIVQNQIKKSVVAAPSDPNGGAKLPKRQEGAPDRKGKGKTQYMAVFDREAERSDDQLDDWLEDTQDATESNDDYVEDAREDDAPEDPDDASFEDSRGDEVYDPYTEDDTLDEDDLESLDLPVDEEYVNVRGHKRRKLKKSQGDDEFDELTDDDDEDDEGEDDDEDEKPKKKDDKERRKKLRKSLGVDAMKYVDGSPLVKSLVDAIMDWRDETTSEIRQLRLENKKLHARFEKLVQRENREMAKALVASQAQFSAVPVAEVTDVPEHRNSQSVRKSVGAPIQTAQRPLPREFDLAKSLDVLEENYVNNGDPSLRNDMTQLELYGANAIGSISRTAQEILRQNKLL